MTTLADSESLTVTVRPRARTWTAARRRFLVIGTGYVALVVGFSYIYGLLPRGGSFPLATYAGVEGWVYCLQDGLTTCPYMGYPVGVRLSLGIPIFVGAYLLSILGIGVVTALNILGVLCLAAGIAATWALVLRLSGDHLAAVLSVLLYCGSGVIVAHAGLISLFYGFALLPVPVAAALLALDSIPSFRPFLLATGVLLIVGFLLVYLDPYPYVIASLIGGTVGVVGIARYASRREWRLCALALVIVGAVALPGLVYQRLERDKDLSVEMPMDFYRAMGTDLGPMLVPTRQQAIGDILRAPLGWNARTYYADGSQLAAAFMGPILMISAAVGLIILARRARSRALAIALAVAGAGCFLLGLGPSLKVFDHASHVIPANGTFSVADYLMPAREATWTFPWERIFTIQPFASMRGTYRWHVGFRLLCVVLAGVTVAALARRSRILACVLAALLLLEATPDLLLHARRTTEHQFEQVQLYERDMTKAFAGRLHPGERVLFLPYEADYLLGGISPRFKVHAYNMSFDKEVHRIQPLQPAPIVAAIRAYYGGTLDRDMICGLFQQDLVDAVVFPDFRLRWDATSWPPSKAIQAELQRTAEDVGVIGDPAFETDKGYLATIVRSATPEDGQRETCAGTVEGP
jgi:hypothetical protein